jgi:fluoroquinolone transport system permease protein
MRWDLLRQQRHHIITASAVVTLLSLIVMAQLPASHRQAMLITLIFNEPAGMGLMFIGALYLFERSENTLQALHVIPLRSSEYLLSKALTLSLLAIVASLVMAALGHGWQFHYGYFIGGIGGSATLFAFLGFGIVVGCRSFYEYVLKGALVLIPMVLPFLNLFDITDTGWWYILPVQGSLVLLENGFGKPAGWQTTYAISYLLLTNAAAYGWALRRFQESRIPS